VHEASIAASVFDLLTETVQKDLSFENKKITKIFFNQGRPFTVSPESFEFYFLELVKQTRFEGAELIFNETPEKGFYIASLEVEE